MYHNRGEMGEGGLWFGFTLFVFWLMLWEGLQQEELIQMVGCSCE